VAQKRGLARNEIQGDLQAAIRSMMYQPEYADYA